jgi:hypothetical protein
MFSGCPDEEFLMELGQLASNIHSGFGVMSC